MNEDIIARASGIISRNIGDSGYCALALIDGDGYPHASTISPAKTSGIRVIHFCTGFGARTAKIGDRAKASVCFNSPEYNVTLDGTIEIVTDPAVKRDAWYDAMSAHFSGPEDPGYCVLRFTTERYSLFVDLKEARGTI
ncbi:MAG: pyridoxamine 5'-phosphate oxidase family protein [Clostridiales bacterium]|nr:pyridoxamine 5'-phosphate oxidase family protein [Clostridiales bacterium]